VPNPFHPSLLDTALARLAPQLQARFARLATEDIGRRVRQARAPEQRLANRCRERATL
jgi:hypothetical protein